MQTTSYIPSLEMLNRKFNNKPDPNNHKPFIYFNQMKGSLYMMGKSTEVNIGEQIAPLLDLVDEYFSFSDKFSCHLDFEDINASTCKFLFKFFRKLQSYKDKKTVSITWRIQDETSDLLDVALEFVEIYGIKINIQYKSRSTFKAAA